jgi:hypothetical protein
MGRAGQLSSRLARRGWRGGEKGFATVTPCQVNPGWRSSDRSKRQPPSEAEARMTASQKPRRCTEVSSAAATIVVSEVSRRGKASRHVRIARRACEALRFALRTSAWKSSPSTCTGSATEPEGRAASRARDDAFRCCPLTPSAYTRRLVSSATLNGNPRRVRRASSACEPWLL